MIRWLIVGGLERACQILDAIPWHEEGRWYRHGQRGCVIGLAQRSAELDERWHTGWWKSIDPDGGP